MISWIKGELVSSWQINNKFYLLINCQGLGYEIQTIESIFNKINTPTQKDKQIVLWLKHIKKEHSDLLFGFISKYQRDFFIEILNIKGIGAQIGIALLNKLSLNEIINAIINNDKNLISSVQGIGQKMTERIILELKSKLITKQNQNEELDKSLFLSNNSELSSMLNDIEITLKSLSYPMKDIKNAKQFLINGIKNKKNSANGKENICFENLLKEAMNYLDNNSNLNQ